MKKVLFIISLSVCQNFFGNSINPIAFIENKNQWPAEVRFGADLVAGQVFIEKSGLTWKLYNLEDINRYHSSRLVSEKANTQENYIRGHNFSVDFVNANLNVFLVKEPLLEYYNYFQGNDPAHWVGHVRAFQDVIFTEVYKNIDLKFYSCNSTFKYDFIIKKGGDIKLIKLKYKHINGISLKNNSLFIHTSIGDLIESIPVAYQIVNGKKIVVECKYVVNGNEIYFEIGKNYDPNRELIVDPTVVVASYSGTKSLSFGLGVSPDEFGNMYLYSLNITRSYPITMGAFQSTSGGGIFDCTLSKFNSTGTAKRFSTYIGGNAEETIINCFIQNNEVAIFGTTRSDTFPVHNSGFQTKIGGLVDYFVMKLDTTGSILLGSTYLGGSRTEANPNIGNYFKLYQIANITGELIMDKWNNCYIIGCTISFDFPVTNGAYRVFSDSNNLAEITITKLKPDLTGLLWSTYYGGSFSNAPVGLRLSSSGDLYCAGTTSSRNFPTTAGVVFTSSVSTLDMVVFVLDTLIGYPVRSTYVGAKQTEAFCFALDKNDNAYLTGGTLAPQTTTETPGALNLNSGLLTFYKLKSDLSQVSKIAKLGYVSSLTKQLEIDAFKVDDCGYIYFGGYGLNGLPVTSNALKSVASQKGNFYFGVLDPNFASLRYASYFGGPSKQYSDHDDGGLNYFDDRGYFYHACCVDDGLPITLNAYSAYSVIDSMGSGSSAIKNSDAFLKIDLHTFVNVNSSLGNQVRSCTPITATFVASSNLGTVTIIPGDGSPSVNSNTLVHTYSSYGTYTAFVVAGTDSSTCNLNDSVVTIIKYGPAPVRNLKDSVFNCSGTLIELDAGNSGSTYIWNNGEVTGLITPTATGMYKVKIDNGFCTMTDSSYVISEKEPNTTLPNAFTPNGDGVNDKFCLRGWDACNTEFKIVIFDRWGEMVYESTDPTFCWDGTYKGRLLSAEVYIYLVTAKYKDETNVSKKGNITLIR